MKRTTPAADPDAYVARLRGWRRETVDLLRSAATSTRGLEEAVKWGHLVYSLNGPVLLIRAEPTRVLFGFWRGKRLRAIEPRLRGGGKYEMATLELKKGDAVDVRVARRLVKAAVALDKELGDPTAPTRSAAASTTRARPSRRKGAR